MCSFKVALTVELFLASFARQTGQLACLLVDHRVAHVTLLDAFVLSVEVSLPEGDSVVQSAVLVRQVDRQLLDDLASLESTSDVLE